jgi:hypothetical protein
MKIGDLVMPAYAWEGMRPYGIIIGYQPPPSIGDVSEDVDGFIVLWSDSTTTYESEFELDPADWNQD